MIRISHISLKEFFTATKGSPFPYYVTMKAENVKLNTGKKGGVLRHFFYANVATLDIVLPNLNTVGKVEWSSRLPVGDTPVGIKKLPDDLINRLQGFRSTFAAIMADQKEVTQKEFIFGTIDDASMESHHEGQLDYDLAALAAKMKALAPVPPENPDVPESIPASELPPQETKPETEEVTDDEGKEENGLVPGRE